MCIKAKEKRGRIPRAPRLGKEIEVGQRLDSGGVEVVEGERVSRTVHRRRHEVAKRWWINGRQTSPKGYLREDKQTRGVSGWKIMYRHTGAILTREAREQASPPAKGEMRKAPARSGKAPYPPHTEAPINIDPCLAVGQHASPMKHDTNLSYVTADDSSNLRNVYQCTRNPYSSWSAQLAASESNFIRVLRRDGAIGCPKPWA